MGFDRRRTERQEQFWIAAESITSGPRHAFYDHFNKVLDSIAWGQNSQPPIEHY